MQNLLSKYEDLKVKSIEVTSTVRSLESSLNQFKALKKQKELEIEDLKKESIIQDKSIIIMKELIDKLSQQHIKKLVDLLSFALSTVFYDKNYSVELKVENKRDSKSARFFLMEKIGEDILQYDFEDGIGGGILAIVGFILQVFYLGYFKLAKVIFCDESFSQISDQYIDGLMSFIHQLSEKKGFIFVLVSHDKRLIERGDKIYEVENGKVSEITKD